MAENRIQTPRKRRKGRDFTIAETLITVLILLMVTSVVAAGIPAAKEAYEKVVFNANAEMLLSTSVTAIRGQLVTAGNVKVEADGKTIGFYSSNTGFNEKIYPEESEDGTLMVLEYSGEGPESRQVVRKLVSDAAATKDLYVTWESVACEGKVVTINGLSVRRKSRAGTGEKPVSEAGPLKIRVIGNEPEKDGL